jgi:hypothetical protein
MTSPWHDLLGGFGMLAKIFLILVPIVTGLDLLKTYGVLARLRRPMEPLLRLLGLSPEAGEPFLAGVGFGMVYGAGIILLRVREHDLPRRDIAVLSSILCAAHALPEDTMIFVSIGANGLLILAVRIVLLVAVSAVVRAVYRPKPV